MKYNHRFKSIQRRRWWWKTCVIFFICCRCDWSLWKGSPHGEGRKSDLTLFGQSGTWGAKNVAAPQKEPWKLNFPWKYVDKYESLSVTSIFQVCIDIYILVFYPCLLMSSSLWLSTTDQTNNFRIKRLEISVPPVFPDQPLSELAFLGQPCHRVKYLYYKYWSSSSRLGWKESAGQLVRCVAALFNTNNLCRFFMIIHMSWLYICHKHKIHVSYPSPSIESVLGSTQASLTLKLQTLHMFML